jgi:glycosyltransferase involved in cell wall biosynthesis
MKLSVIIPAYNEEKYLPATLESIRAALAGLDEAEVIVVDNESTDGTRVVAERSGAAIVEEHEHNIGKVRNTGGENAAGDVLVFVDADTRVQPGLFENILEVMSDERCFGGSVAVEYEESRRRWVRFYLMAWQFWGRVLKMHQGAAQFCRRDAFRELGGYDPTIYVGEDIEFLWRLAKLARSQPKRGYTTFIAVPAVRTSARRYSKMGLLRLLIVTHPITILLAWRIRSVWKDWYENAVR